MSTSSDQAQIIDGLSRDPLALPEPGQPFADTHALEARISQMRQQAYETFLIMHEAADQVSDPVVREQVKDAANLWYATRMNEIDMTMNGPEVYEQAVTDHLDAADRLVTNS